MADWIVDQHMDAAEDYAMRGDQENEADREDGDDSNGPIGPVYFSTHKKHTGCRGHQVTRTNSKTGKKFKGCSEFPRCRWSGN